MYIFSDLLVKVPRSRGTFGLDDRFKEEVSPFCKGDEKDFYTCRRIVESVSNSKEYNIQLENSEERTHEGRNITLIKVKRKI